MNDFMPAEPTASMDSFRRANSRSAKGRGRDRADGARIFFRLDDEARLRLLSVLIPSLLNHEQLNASMVGSFLREAFTSEPCISNIRLGSYVSEVMASTPGGANWSMGELAESWGDAMMTLDEAGSLDALTSPMTVYRGGIGSPIDLAHGVSWTLLEERARFFAEAWPSKQGLTGPPVVLSLSVETHEIAAYFDDRSEAEVLIPFAGDRYAETKLL